MVSATHDRAVGGHYLTRLGVGIDEYSILEAALKLEQEERNLFFPVFRHKEGNTILINSVYGAVEVLPIPIKSFFSIVPDQKQMSQIIAEGLT